MVPPLLAHRGVPPFPVFVQLKIFNSFPFLLSVLCVLKSQNPLTLLLGHLSSGIQPKVKMSHKFLNTERLDNSESDTTALYVNLETLN